jgi:hypothetical protein
MNFDTRLAIDLIYPDEFTQGMIYNLLDLPVGFQVYVSAWWDSDFNGILTSADRITYTSQFTTQSNPINMNLSLTSRYIRALPWVHLLLLSEN